MSKKNSKTIMSLIVFVVFFGIGIFAGLDNVFAYNNYSTTCVYGWPGTAKFAFHINHDGGLTDYVMFDDGVLPSQAGLFEQWKGFNSQYVWKRAETLDLHNWGPKFEGFSGSEYYVNNEVNGKRQCPPAAIYIEYIYSHDLILSDGTQNHIDSVEIYFLKEETTIDGSGIKGIIKTVTGFGSYVLSEIASRTTGTEVEQHITEIYQLIEQHYYDEPDPKNEEVIDDGTVREWVNPKIKTVTPLDEDDYKYSCGDGMLTGIPSRLPKFGKFLYNFLQFLVPIVLVLMGTIDLVKSTTGGKEDEIKKNQLIFVKRLAGAILIFFSFAIIKLVLSVVAENSAPIIKCTDCILRHSSNCIVESN